MAHSGTLSQPGTTGTGPVASQVLGGSSGAHRPAVLKEGRAPYPSPEWRDSVPALQPTDHLGVGETGHHLTDLGLVAHHHDCPVVKPADALGRQSRVEA